MSLVLDPVTEARIQQALATGPFREPAELIAHALDLVEAEAADDWLLRNKQAINAALDESFAAKERGEFYSPEEVRAEIEARRHERKSRAA
jgi:predicted transcriptional regulator